QQRDRLALRSVLPGAWRLGAAAASNCGSILLGGVDDSIFCWFLADGQLVNINQGAHYQSITKLKFAPGDDSVVVSAGKDGLVQVWNLAELLAKPGQNQLGKGNLSLKSMIWF